MFFNRYRITTDDGRKVDLLELAREATSVMTEDVDVDPKELAKIAKERGLGKRVLKRDNPLPIDFHLVNALLGRMLKIVQGERQVEQSRALARVRPLPFTLAVSERCCERARRAATEERDADDLERTPFPDCPLNSTCHCLWRQKK